MDRQRQGVTHDRHTCGKTNVAQICSGNTSHVSVGGCCDHISGTHLSVWVVNQLTIFFLLATFSVRHDQASLDEGNDKTGNVLVFNHKQNLKLLYYASILFISMSIRFQYSTEALYVYFGPCATLFMLINRMAAEKNTPDLMTNHWLIDLLNHTGLRILVNLLLDTLPMLGNVLLLCFFVFFIFGIIGVQLWAGLLRNRCYLEENFTLWVEPCVCGMFIC